MSRLTIFVLSILTTSSLLTACDSNKLSIKEANEIILETQDLLEGSMESDLIEITPPDVWKSTKHQLFKNLAGGSWETFVVANQKAVPIGNGFGGSGVISVLPYDVNKDGTMDIVYAYSFGSGIHRSLISWLDLKDLTEHNVLDKPKSKGFRLKKR